MADGALLAPLLGGCLIGLGATWLLLSLGRVAGVTGILSGLLSPKPAELGWRGGFLLGLLVAGTVASGAGLTPTFTTSSATLPLVILAGLLVGFGARLGGGCTSGHGICGVSRLNPRSIVATTGFIFAGAVAVWLMRHVFGGAS
jgi:uncharacterized membrane protein YedE/YeeE